MHPRQSWWTVLLRVRQSVIGGRKWIVFGLLTPFVMAGHCAQAQTLSQAVRRADDFYQGRQNLENVKEGLDGLRAEVAQNPGEYEAWWRISKLASYQARHASGGAKIKLLEEGIEAGKKAVALAPDRVEGHFWLGSNYDLMSTARGFLRGLLWVDAIRKEMEFVERIDPGYEEAGGARILGRLDYRAPFFLGGDRRLSLQLFKQCLLKFPDNSLTMLYLADSYLALGMRQDARQELEQVLNSCPDPDSEPEQEENQQAARARLAKYFQASNG